MLAGIVGALFIRALPVSGRRERWRDWKFLAGAIIAAAVAVWYFGFVVPDPDQVWAPDHARMPQVEIDGDLVHVKDVRNFTWRSATDFTPAYYDRTYDLSKISSMYYLGIVSNRNF